MRARPLALGLVALAAAACTGSSRSSTPPPLPASASSPATVTPLPLCPHRVPATPHNAAPPSDRLVWRQPTRGELCRYYPVFGLSGRGVPHGTLYGHASMDSATAGELAATLDRMPSIAKGERIACPAAFGTHDLLFFGYADGRVLEVLATPDGCPSFTNGRYTTGDFSPAYARYLKLVSRLVPTKQQRGRNAPSPVR